MTGWPWMQGAFNHVDPLLVRRWSSLVGRLSDWIRSTSGTAAKCRPFVLFQWPAAVRKKKQFKKRSLQISAAAEAEARWSAVHCGHKSRIRATRTITHSFFDTNYAPRSVSRPPRSTSANHVSAPVRSQVQQKATWISAERPLLRSFHLSPALLLENTGNTRGLLLLFPQSLQRAE